MLVRLLLEDERFALALSSSIVETLRVSRVTSIANCFLVPLSLSEWARTIAPEDVGQY